MIGTSHGLLVGCVLVVGCASGAGAGAAPGVVENRALGRVDPGGPVDLDALAPPCAGPGVLPAGVASSRGGFALTLVLTAGPPMALELYDLRQPDGGGPCYSVSGTEAGGAAPAMGVIRVARDGHFLAVPVQEGTSWCVVLAELQDGVFREVASTDAAWPYVDWPALAPDRQRLAFWAADGSEPGGSSATVVERRGAKLVVVDRVARGCYKHWPSFTADGRLVVRVMVDEEGTSERIVMDGVASRDYERTGIPRCSPAGAHVAASVRRGRQGWLWIDGHELGPFDDVGDPRFDAEDLVATVVRNGPEVSWLVARAAVGSRGPAAGLAR